MDRDATQNASAAPVTVGFVSLGCPKNLVDSEKMVGQLAEAGCAITPDTSEADVIVVNTCGFLAASRAEALEVIAEMAEHKRDGPCRRIVVAGCLVQRDGEALREAAPAIDALVGVHNRDDLVRAVLGDAAGKRKRTGPDLYLGDYHPHAWRDDARARLTPQHYAYLRVSEGCDQRCTFCTIPSIRGPMHSKPPAVILDEARELIADGAVELNLIGQDTTSYGRDIGYDAGLAGLLREIDKLDGLQWARLMYAYPSVFTDEMIAAIAESDRIANYVDIPLQHINNRVLRAMARRTTRAQTEQLLDKLRSQVQDITIRTTFIAGFPGETEAEFEELLAFVRDFGFDALGVFAYSHEPDTPAGRMPGLLPKEERAARAETIMETQQPIAFARAARYIGRRFKVLVDDHEEYENVGRHAGQAPDVDPVTYIIADEDYEPGEIVEVKCTATDEYDLMVRPVNIRLPVVQV